MAFCRRRSKKRLGFVMIFSTFLFVYILFSLEDEYINMTKKSPGQIKYTVSLQKVVFHLDLKGALPRLTYLRRLLPSLKEHGVNTLLVEYEDMFPYENKLVNLSSPNKYSRHKLQNLLTEAVLYGFEIIPLVQTFGHLEFALKLPEFRHLSETPHTIDSICPSKNGSLLLIKEMLKQIIEFHEKVAPLMHIHIGCDEVFHINRCSECQRRKITKSDLYISHVETVVATVKLLNPKTVILIWDDMMRQIKPGPFYRLTSNLRKNVEPVVWDYSPSLAITHHDLYKYKSFKNIWIATAFKGAELPTSILPDLNNRYLNNFRWMQLISQYKFGGQNEVYAFKGVILTGWSRFNHTAPLCELLPSSTPSLVLNLMLIKRVKQGITYEDHRNDLMSKPYAFYNKYLKVELMKQLECQTDISEKFNIIGCKYDGIKLYKLLQLFKFTVIDRWKSNYFDANSTDIVKYRIDGIHLFGDKLAKLLDPYYNSFVINEYVETTIYIQREKARSFL